MCTGTDRWIEARLELHGLYSPDLTQQPRGRLQPHDTHNLACFGIVLCCIGSQGQCRRFRIQLSNHLLGGASLEVQAWRVYMFKTKQMFLHRSLSASSIAVWSSSLFRRRHKIVSVGVACLSGECCVSNLPLGLMTRPRPLLAPRYTTSTISINSCRSVIAQLLSCPQRGQNKFSVAI